MNKEFRAHISRPDFMKLTGLVTLTVGAAASLFGFPAVRAKSSRTQRQASGGPYHILSGTGGTP